MDEKENTGAESSAVTAIKVKVVIDTTTEELKNQFKGVQNSFKKVPVEIAFGVNEGATIGNVNAALKRIIKKVENPKLTLKIDESNIDAAIQKATKKVQGSTSKSSGAIKVNVDVDESEKKLKEFYSLVENVNTLNNKALSLPEGSVRELEECNRQLDKMGTRMTELMNELSGNIEIGEFSKLDTIMNELNNRSALFTARLADIQAKSGQKEFYSLVKEIGELNNKLSTADPSKKGSQIEVWQRRLAEAETELTNLMNTLSV